MTTPTFSQPESSVQYWDMLTYLIHTDWKLIDDSTSRFIVFKGPEDQDNNPLEIIFLRNPDAREQPLYIKNAVEILSLLKEIEPWRLIQDISNVNRDSLRIRILGVDSGDAISLRIAALQIYELKQLVAYAARSEVDQKPFYLNAQTPEARNTVNAYRFGHTFKGSFGFTIETPKLLDIHLFTQLSLLPQLVTNKDNLPRWRKVMERIVRGLTDVQEATRERDPRVIVQNFKSGLNANMCQALVNMLLDKRLTLEYSVKWAALKLPDDPVIQYATPIELSEPASNQLEYAANELMELQPQKETISGLIIELSAKDSPLELDTSRTVRIRWFEEAEGKTFEATATLNRDDYLLAIKAHENWNSIQITGTLSRYKRNWRFIDYTDFQIKN